MSKNQEYAEKYAGYAMEQMRRYGIPASVTLAQGILESSNGQSQLAQNENNHFGIKATPSWIDEGGRYGHIEYVVHLLCCLSYCKSSYGISRKIKLADSLGVIYSDILVYGTLIDSKQ